MNGSLKSVSAAFENIAKERGVSVEQVREDIQAAIREGLSSTDPKTQSLWASICHDGVPPTPDDFILYLAQATQKCD